MKKFLLTLSVLFSISQQAQNAGLAFDGMNDVVNTPMTFGTASGHWTYECWVKSPNVPVSNNGYDGPMYGGNMGIIWNHAALINCGSATVQDATGAYHFASFGPLAANTWYHLAATYDGSVLKAYKNGDLMASTTTAGGLFNASGNLSIGKHPYQLHYWEGTIDEVRIWNEARTCAQINTYINTVLTGSEANLLAYYNFDDGIPASNNTSITTVLDQSPNAKNGTLSGFTLNGSSSNFVSGTPSDAIPVMNCSTTTPAKCLNFDGNNDYAAVPNSPLLQLSTGTVEAWFKTVNAGQGYRAIVTKEQAYGIFLKANQLMVYQWGNGVENVWPVNLNNNVWHHVAFSFNAGMLNGSHLYLDGIQVATFSYNINNQTGSLTIGTNGTSPHFFNGEIDEVRVWNRQLCPDEIQINRFCEPGSGTPNLVAAYHLNNGFAGATNSGLTTAADGSGNNLNATMTNFSLTGGYSNWAGSSNTALIAAGCYNYQTITYQNGNEMGIDTPEPSYQYQWINCSTMAAIPTATASTYTATANGSYALVVTNNGCSSTSPCMAVTTTGINENVFAEKGFIVYPNPAQGQLHIETQHELTVQLISVIGEVIMTETFTGKKTIATDHLSAGIYFIKDVQSGKSVKFVKE